MPDSEKGGKFGLSTESNFKALLECKIGMPMGLGHGGADDQPLTQVLELCNG